MFGINLTVKQASHEYCAKVADIIEQLGIEVVRLEFDWYHEVPPEILEGLVDTLRSRNVEVLALLTGLVPGSLRNVFGNAKGYRQPFDELNDFLRFTERLAKQYQGKIKYWEIWNEQNTARFWLRKPSAKEYLQVAAESSKVIRDLVPESQIILGSLCGNDVDLLAPNIPRGYLQELLDLGIDDHVDIYGIHPYTLACYVSLKSRKRTLHEIKSRVDHFQERYPQITKPIWITEIGISRTWVKLSMEDIAKIYHELINDFEARGMTTLLWCLTDFNDPIYVKGNPEKSFGLVDTQLQLNETGKTLLSLRKS